MHMIVQVVLVQFKAGTHKKRGRPLLKCTFYEQNLVAKSAIFFQVYGGRSRV